YGPRAAMLAVAGQFDWKQCIDVVAETMGDWKPQDIGEAPIAGGAVGYEHIAQETSQTHIGFSFPCVPVSHPDYFSLRGGVGILSDGMSSRLFDRVREQRGLCYTVSAGVHSLKESAAVFGYAGTTPQRAQETLDVTLHEIRSLCDDLSNEELDRLKVRMQSNLIMEQESSGAKAGGLINDWYHLGRVMTNQEIQQRIEALTIEDIASYWSQRPPQDFRVVTLGPESLRV
ncbi:MAG: insulinase family protein, partial [Planctomycetota bacterium]